MSRPCAALALILVLVLVPIGAVVVLGVQAALRPSQAVVAALGGGR